MILFNKKTRRVMGEVTENAPGLIGVLVDAPMPTWQEAAYLKADDITIISKPSTTMTPPPRVAITKLAFMSLFTDTELAAIFTAAKSNVAVEIWVEKLKAATQVHLDNPQLIAGVQALETAKLLATGRAAVILK